MLKPLTPNDSKQFLVILQQDTQLLNDLIIVLDGERSAIEQRDQDKLRALHTRKENLLTELSTSDVNRQRFLLSFNCKHRSEDILKLIETTPAGVQKVLRDAWGRLEHAIRECDQRNRLNEKIIFHSRQNVERLLSILCGRNDATDTYQQNGKAAAANRYRSIAKA
ncbi:MAG TPA: flagellar protein FlgN [Pseudomonadales bacterium]|nr:flagellar protein FlgN [Pseudomonadales bacterium]